MSDAPRHVEVGPPIERATIPVTLACPFCCTDVDHLAVICPNCRSTRREEPGGTWKNYREARRTDIMVSILAAVFILWIVLGVLTVLLIGRTSTTTYSPVYTPCTKSNPNYPFC